MGLVDERDRLERVVAALPAHLGGGEAHDLAVEHLEERRPRVVGALLDAAQETGDASGEFGHRSAEATLGRYAAPPHAAGLVRPSGEAAA